MRFLFLLSILVTGSMAFVHRNAAKKAITLGVWSGEQVRAFGMDTRRHKPADTLTLTVIHLPSVDHNRKLAHLSY